MDFAKALVADELWGWPVDVLDRLLELRRLAWDGAISLDDWREQDAAYRVGRPMVDRNEVRKFQVEWLVNEPRDAPEDVRSRFTGRLTALAHSAPSDEELWEELSTAHEALAGPRRDPELERIHRADRDRIAAWLTRPGSGIDPTTGLPWLQIARYRVIDDPNVGRVPQYVDSARQLAMNNASAADRQRADMVAATTTRPRLAVATAELSQKRLIWFPSLLVDAAEDDEELRPLLADLMGIWSDARVQRLLLGETSRGWPPPYDQDPEQESL